MYQSFEPAGFTVLPWMRMSWHRDPDQELGLVFVGNASIALDELGGTRRVVGVRALGAATVGGVATTRYELSTAPVCKPVHPSPLVETQGPSFVWVDAEGRLVQVSGSLRVSGHLPAAVQGTFPALGSAYPVTTTDTLRLSGFGQPVHIEAPTNLATPNSSGGSFVINLSLQVVVEAAVGRSGTLRGRPCNPLALVQPRRGAGVARDGGAGRSVGADGEHGERRPVVCLVLLDAPAVRPAAPQRPANVAASSSVHPRRAWPSAPGATRCSRTSRRPSGRRTRRISARPCSASAQWWAVASDQATEADPSRRGSASAVPST